uniref:hypothetical protein n=1 Tax=Streptomyces sp. CA-136453 TaxID=3240050 RepID=UPI003F490D0D
MKSLPPVFRSCLVPRCGAAFDWSSPWPAGWRGIAGPGARALYACPEHSAAWDLHRPATRRYPDEGGVAAMCACGWTTDTVPTLGMLETAFLEHLVPELTTPVVAAHALG